jgi:hypothetical protein
MPVLCSGGPVAVPSRESVGVFDLTLADSVPDTQKMGVRNMGERNRHIFFSHLPTYSAHTHTHTHTVGFVRESYRRVALIEVFVASCTFSCDRSCGECVSQNGHVEGGA